MSEHKDELCIKLTKQEWQVVMEALYRLPAYRENWEAVKIMEGKQ